MSLETPTANKKVPLATKSHIAWCVYNWGIPWSVERTRRDAIDYAVDITGKPWNQCKKYCTVQKVEVKPL